MKKVLWLSREPFQPVQFGALERLLGKPLAVVALSPDDIEDDTIDEIVEFFDRQEFDNVVAVLPKVLLRQLVEAGLRPLWADCQPVTSRWGREHFTAPGGRRFRFLGFKRVDDATLRLQDLGPEADWRPEDSETAGSVDRPPVWGLHDRSE